MLGIVAKSLRMHFRNEFDKAAIGHGLGSGTGAGDRRKRERGVRGYFARIKWRVPVLPDRAGRCSGPVRARRADAYRCADRKNQHLVHHEATWYERGGAQFLPHGVDSCGEREPP